MKKVAHKLFYLVNVFIIRSWTFKYGLIHSQRNYAKDLLLLLCALMLVVGSPISWCPEDVLNTKCCDLIIDHIQLSYNEKIDM